MSSDIQVYDVSPRYQGIRSSRGIIVYQSIPKIYNRATIKPKTPPPTNPARPSNPEAAPVLVAAAAASLVIDALTAALETVTTTLELDVGITAMPLENDVDASEVVVLRPLVDFGDADKEVLELESESEDESSDT